ncbi:MAG TPA: D-amino-acid transaminase [Candidatus Manganitrophaceae bacterium]|nr:D-amino-acid transaminase [Candidatus Manganitrophaceae bacterium]
MPNIAFVNGKWSPLGAAKVSVEDRGFQFGDGVYELLRTYGGEIFHLEEHLARLEASAKEIEIALPYTARQMEKFIRLGCRKSGYADSKVYIQVTRGAAPRLHSFPSNVRPTVVMTFRRFEPLPEKLRREGVAVISLDDIRWGRCHVKSLNLLPNVMAREQALRAGAFEAIFIRNGKVTEGAGSNVFAVVGKKVITPPAGPYILSGITREVVLQVGKKEGLEMIEKELKLPTLYAADELFLTGTTVEVLPIVKLNGKAIGAGMPGKITQFLSDAFRRSVAER